MTTGAICVNTLKKDWTPETSFSHVLSVIRCLLIVPFPESSLNDEAGKLFMESYDEYAKRAKLMADIHGRTKPVKEQPNTTEEENEGALPRSNLTVSSNSDRSLKTVNRTSKPTGKGQADSRKTKKKSLRRL